MIFINYRKADTFPEVDPASRLLKERYGEERVFVDFDDIPEGAVWPDHLREQLNACRVLLVFVGPAWGKVQFETGDNAGRQRLDVADDWVRQEICTALARGNTEVNVIVIKVRGAELPPTKWRCELDLLHERQHTQWRNGKDYKRDFEDLCAAIENWLPELREIAQQNKNKAETKHAATLDQRSSAALESYLSAERRNHAMIQLPLVTPKGEVVAAPLSKLRIDLPLVVSHWRGTPDKELIFGHSTEASSIHSQFRSGHASSYEQEQEAQYKALSRRDFTIGTDLKADSRLVIIGDPGCGKSTLLQWIAHHYAWAQRLDLTAADAPENSEFNLPNENWVPILLFCRDFSRQAMPTRWEDLFRAQLQARQFSNAEIDVLLPCFENLLKAGKAILLIDGLDEIPRPENRVAFCSVLKYLANNFPKSPIVLTSRVVGFQVIKEALTTNFDHLVVAPLDRTAKRNFLENWARNGLWKPELTEQLIEKVCDARELAKLTDNVFLLALVTQIQVLDIVLPERRVDIYRRAVQLMIRRRQAFAGEPLLDNEVIPHLEYLGYHIRNRGLQRFLETDALELFRELRQLESGEPVLQRRSPELLLQACIDSLGILQVAGIETDKRGFDRQVLQFFHQSFQEYFAGQAIKHGYGVAKNSKVVTRLSELLNKIEINEREVNLWGQYKVTEPILADYWQEAVRLAIADLNADDANEAILMLLPDKNTPLLESRPRAVFALLCLADGPKISPATAAAVLDAVLDNIWENDGFNTKLNTWMDVAIAAAMQSSFGPAVQERLVRGFMEHTGKKRNQIGCCIVLRALQEGQQIAAENAAQVLEVARKGLSAASPPERVLTALELMNHFYLVNGKLDFLEPAQREEFIQLLVSALSSDEATQNAALWALSWMCSARSRRAGEKGLENLVQLPSSSIPRLEEILTTLRLDHYTYSYSCLLRTREQGLNIVIHQQDWVLLLANIADGNFPRRELAPVAAVGVPTESIMVMRRLLRTDLPIEISCRIAQAIGSLGYYGPELVQPLNFLFQNKKFTSDERDEAFFYLCLTGTPEALAILVEAANTPPTAEDDYFYARGLFGLLMMDKVEILAHQMVLDLQHSDLYAYAYGLAGSNNPKGRDLLLQLKQHANKNVSKAAETALAKRWT